MKEATTDKLVDAIAAAGETDRSALIAEHRDDLTEELLTALKNRVDKAFEMQDMVTLHRLLDAGMDIGEFLKRDDVLFVACLCKGFAFSASDEEAAVVWFQKALDKARIIQQDAGNSLSPDSPAGLAVRNIAAITYRQGMRTMSAGDYSEAIRLFTCAATYYQQLSPPSGLDFCYKYLAYAYEYAGRCDSALPWYDNALAQFEAAGNDHEAASVLMSRAGCLKTLGHYDDGVSSLERAAAIYRRLDDRQQAAEVSVRIADIYLTKLNDCEKALEHLGGVTGCGFREQESMALMQTAAVYLSQGRYSLMLRSLENARELLSPPESDFERTQLSDVYNDMAEAFFLLRDFRNAEDTEQKALDLAVSAGHRPGIMLLYESMGNRAFNLGLYEHALKHYLDSAAIAREIGDAGASIRLLNSMGNVYLFLHSAEDAFKVFGEALALSRRDGLRSYEINTLISMGYGDEKTERPEEALHHYRDALGLCGSLEENALLAVACRKGIAGIKASQGLIGEAVSEVSEARSIHRGRGLIRDELYDLMELGMLAQKAKDHERSREFYSEALLLCTNIGMTDERVNCLHGLAFADTAEGKYAEAIDRLNSARDMLDPEKDRFLLFTTCYGLGIAFRKSGRTAAAAEAYLKAWEYMETLRGESSAEDLRIQWMTDKKTLAEEIVEVLLLLGKTEEAFNYVEKGKSRVLAELLALSPVRRPGEINPEDAGTEDDLLATARKIRRDMRADRGGEKFYLLADELSKVSEKLSRLWNAMREAYAGSPEVEGYLDLRSGGSISAKDAIGMIGRISGTTAVVEYFPHRERLYIFILRSDRERPHVVEAEQTEETLRWIIANGIQRGSVTLSTLKFWESNLTKSLVDPVVPYLYGCDLVYLVPFGDMVRLPLHAFRTEAGFRLIEKYDIAYIPSTTLLRFCLRDSLGDFSDMLIMAFEGRPPLKLLDCAYDEANAVVRSFGKGEVCLGSDATVGNLMNKVRDKKVIHLVCHGEFNPDNPMNSCLYLYDGALTADEIFRRMEVRTDLVTLSACQTAQASSRPGDETFGLVRALFHAGAPALLVSLWNVNDSTAPVFMEKFYDRTRTMPLVRALAETQREMIDASGSHPYFWAPFILVGKYR